MNELTESLQRIEVSLSIGDQPLQIEFDVPTGPASARVVLPLFQFLTNTVVDLAEKQVVEAGKTISCKAGCGACCRQLVPISQTEAHHLADQIEILPEPRRSQIQSRFAIARQKIADAGMLAELERPEEIAMSDLNPIGLSYFELGIACPFLEAESCSIHQQRPLACREYLVTSPAENCRNPSAEGIERVELPGHLSRALLQLGRSADSDLKQWVPLILALKWSVDHPEPLPDKTGPHWVDEALAKIGG